MQYWMIETGLTTSINLQHNDAPDEPAR